MKKVTKEQLGTIMHNFMTYKQALGNMGDTVTDAEERMFVLGALSTLLGKKAADMTLDEVPAIVGMCWMSGRPLSSLGNWELTDTRLATASDTLGGGR